MTGDPAPGPALRPEDFGIGRLYWHIRDAVAVVSAADGRIVLWNPGAEHLFGYTADEALSLTIGDLFATANHALLAQEPVRIPAGTGRAAGESGRQLRELEARCKDGTSITVEIALSDAGERDGGRYLLAIMHDVSWRLRRVREQEVRAEELRANQRLQFLVEAGTLLSSTLDFDTVAQRIMGLAVPALADWFIIDLLEPDGRIRRLDVRHADPALQPVVDELLAHYGPELNPPNHPLNQVLATGTPRFLPVIPPDWPESVAVDAEHLRLLRAIAPHSGVLVPLVTTGRILGALTFAFGTSGRTYSDEDLALAEELGRRAAVALDNARLYREAQEAIAVRDRFLSVASHELRTPLTAIKARLQLAMRQIGRNPEAVLDGLAKADQQVDRLNRLVGDLLDVSRLTAGRFVIHSRPLDPLPLVLRVVEEQRALEAGRPISVAAPEAPFRVIADEDRLEQVLVNLLQNARKYSPAGSPISVQLSAVAGAGVISVADHGGGIAPEELPHLFEPFHRAASVDRSVAGFGLGLYIAHEIVRAHGGEIAVESVPGEGSTFSVSLPLADERAA